MNVDQSMAYIRDFQLGLLYHLLWCDEFYTSCSSYVTVMDFPDPSCQVFYEALQTYRRASNRVPGSRELGQTLTTILQSPESQSAFDADADMGQLRQVAAFMWTLHPTDPDYYKNTLTDYLQRVRMLKVMNQQSYLSDREYMAQVAEIHNLTIVTGKDTGMSDAWLAPEIVTQEAAIEKIPTNVRQVNKALGRGLGVGEMGVVTACSGIGKTNAKLNFATGAVYNRHHALFITFEMDGASIKRRYQAICANIPAMLLREPQTSWPAQYQERFRYVANYFASCGRQGVGHFTVSDQVGKQLSPREVGVIIRQWQDKVERAFGNEASPLAVYVDWLNASYLRPNNAKARKLEKDHETLPAVVTELRAEARGLGVGLWSSAQAKQQAMSKTWLAMNDVGKAWGINESLDAHLGIAAPDDDKLAKQNNRSDDDLDAMLTPISRKLHMNTLKNRNGQPAAFEIYQGETLRFWNDAHEKQRIQARLDQGDLSSLIPQ